MSRWPLWILTGVLALLVACAAPDAENVTQPGAAPEQEEQTEAEQPETEPADQPRSQDELVAMAQHEGKPVFVDFWSSI